MVVPEEDIDSSVDTDVEEPAARKSRRPESFDDLSAGENRTIRERLEHAFVDKGGVVTASSAALPVAKEKAPRRRKRGKQAGK